MKIIPARLRRLASIACVLALAIGVVGCTKFFYNRLDTLAGWYLDDLVSLDETQRTDLRVWLEQTLQWHRQSELRRYAGFLHELSAEVSQPASPEAHERAARRIQEFGADVVAKVAPEATRLLMGLSPAQVTQFMDRLQERSHERAEEDLEEIEDGSWHAKRTKSIKRQLKRWTGAVTAEQEALVREATKELQPTRHEWLESQSRWRASLREALTSGESPPAVEARILQLLRQPDSQWTPEYKAKSAANRERTLTLLQSLDASLTPTQRERLQRELIELAEKLEALMET